MTAEQPDDEREYLLSLAAQLREIHDELTRLNRRLRNARSAVHNLEDHLAGVVADVVAHAEQMECRRGSR